MEIGFYEFSGLTHRICQILFPVTQRKNELIQVTLDITLSVEFFYFLCHMAYFRFFQLREHREGENFRRGLGRLGEISFFRIEVGVGSQVGQGNRVMDPRGNALGFQKIL